MPLIHVVYFTKTGVTGALAKAVAEGASEETDVKVRSHAIGEMEIINGRFVNDALLEELGEADAIVLGSPTYMGGPAAQFKAFADATSELWCEQLWAGKLGAGFTSGSAPNGDQTSTLQYFVTLASQQGMLWVGLDTATGYQDGGVNRLGSQLGVVAHSPDGSVHDVDLATARYLGRRVASQAHRLGPAPS